MQAAEAELTQFLAGVDGNPVRRMDGGAQAGGGHGAVHVGGSIRLRHLISASGDPLVIRPEGSLAAPGGTSPQGCDVVEVEAGAAGLVPEARHLANEEGVTQSVSDARDPDTPLRA